MKRLLTLVFSMAVLTSLTQAQTIIFNEDFESGSLTGWTHSGVIGTLVWNNTTNRGMDPGHTPTHAAYFGDPNNFNYDTGLTEGEDLTSPAIDLTTNTVARLSFNYFLETEAATGYDVVAVTISTNGTNYDTIATNQSNAVIHNMNETPGGWAHLDLDISAYVGNANVTIRFGFNSIDGAFNTFEGFYVDDVTVYETDPDDLGVESVDAPSSACGLSNNEIVNVTIKNYGTNSQSNFDVTYLINGANPVTETVMATLASGATTTYSFTTGVDMSVAGTYDIDAFTTLPGDVSFGNDSASRQVVSVQTVSTLPYFEDFESGNGGWTAGGSANGTWQYGTPTGSFIGTAASGTKAWVTNLSGNYNPSENSYIQSPCLSFSSLSVDPILRFDQIFNLEAFNDEAWVEVSSDNGQTWTKLGTTISGGTNWYNSFNDSWEDLSGAQNQWRSADHVLTGMAGVFAARIRIVMTSSTFTQFEGMGVDNIFIYEQLQFDAGISNNSAPLTGCGLTNAENVTVTIKNYGYDPITSVDASYQINGGAAVTETVMMNIPPGDSAIYTFTQTADLSAAGNYTFDFYTTLAGDTYTFNDSLSGDVNSLPTITSFPYAENFESGNGGWTTNGTNSSWALGNPAGTVINSAASGSNAWVTNLGGDHLPNEFSFLQSPCLDFSSLTADPTLSFSHIFETEVNGDFGYVEYSTDGGIFWSRLGSIFSGGVNWYNAQFSDWWEGNSGGNWRTASHEMTGLAGQSNVLIRFVMSSNNFIENEGFGVDDINIFPPPPLDAGVAGFSPQNACGLSATQSIGVLVKNFGSDTISNFSVAYQLVPNAANAPETFTNTLNPGDTQTYVFSTTEDLSAPGAYTFNVWVALGGDTINFNDTLTITINNQPAPTANAGKDTIICEGDFTVLGGNPTANEGTAPYNYQWFPTFDFTPNPTVFPTVTTVYDVIVTDQNGCTATDTVMVTVNPAPIAFAGNDTSICEGTTIGLNATGGGTYDWTPSSTLSCANCPTPDATPTSTTTYTLTVTDGNGCSGTDDIVITVLPSVTPVISISANQNPVCDGGNLFLSATFSGGGVSPSFQWRQNGSNVGNNNANFAPNPFANNDQFECVFTSDEMCPDPNPVTSNTVTLTVNPLPTVAIEGLDSNFCEFDTEVTLTGSPDGGNFSGKGVSGGKFNPSLAGLGSHTITYFYTDANNCSNTTTQDVTVNACAGIAPVEGIAGFSLFPNPNNGNFDLRFAQPLQNDGTASLYNSLGSRVMQVAVRQGQKSQSISVAQLPEGIYFIHLQFPGQAQVLSQSFQVMH